jgi:hypothetical protein
MAQRRRYQRSKWLPRSIYPYLLNTIPSLKLLNMGLASRKLLIMLSILPWRKKIAKTISLLLTMLAAHLHLDQHLQPIHVKIVEDAEVAEVEGVDMVVTEELTIPKVVAIAMVVG